MALFLVIDENRTFEGEKMVYRVAVCDDNVPDLEYICSLVRGWADGRQVGVQLERFSSAEGFLFRYAEEKRFDIALLDIEMGEMDGVSLAKRLRQEDETLQIVFVTGYSDYISEGYDVSALHYLMKPVKQEKLAAVLDRAAERLKKQEKTLDLVVGGEMIRVPLYQIRYIDVQLNYATIHGKKDYTVKKTLQELEEALDDGFCRVGRSALVNLACICRVAKKELYLSDGTVIPLPRGAYERINRAIIDMK